MRGIHLVGVMAAVALGSAAPAAADTLHVQNTHDAGNGSLREAIEDAGAGDRIKVPGGHYALTSGALIVDTNLKITGAGARHTVLDANGNSRVLEITGIDSKVSLSGLSVREGDAGDNDGGGVVSDAKLVLKRVAVIKNSVGPPDSFSSGGGVDVDAELVIRQSLFAQNHGYNGGAVAAGGDIKAYDSTFTRNSAGSPEANGDGGAFDDEVTLIDSTVAGNRCFNGDGCGGGLYGATLKGTIVAGNHAYEANGMQPGSGGNPGTNDNCGGSTIDSQGHNLDDHNDCSLAGTGDISGENAKLHKLRNNGGQTNTLALGHPSPAFNGGAGSCTGRDQRGVRRPQGPRCDIGAFELAR